MGWKNRHYVVYNVATSKYELMRNGVVVDTEYDTVVNPVIGKLVRATESAVSLRENLKQLLDMLDGGDLTITVNPNWEMNADD